MSGGVKSIVSNCSLKIAMELSQGSKQTEDDHVCNRCGSKFRSTNALNAHQRSHQNTTCAHCGIKFEPYGRYTFHMATAHRPSYQCLICQHVEQSPELLVAHILSHPQLAAEARHVYSQFRKVE